MAMKGRLVYRGRNVRVSFDMDYNGIARVAMGPELKAACHNVVASKALPYAVSISPRSRSTSHRHYQDSFQVKDVTVISIGKPPMLRVGTHLANTSPHAVMVEVGTSKVPRHRILGKTLSWLDGSG